MIRIVFAALLLAGCVTTTHSYEIPRIMVPVPVRVDLCDPPRGEDQEVDVLVHGHAFDSIPTSCI